ncbi:MAG: TIGR03943 family protein [Anaerolineae bacterium]|nr:TIGR03943 family protein [Anaerolineae bacterium]NUQ05616.1 TIGR03943 family protein [Anaerolineae bacterium]
MSVLNAHPEHDHAHEYGGAQTAQLWLKTAILLGLGVYFVYNILTGNLTNYVNERFAWLSYVAAALLLVIGAYSAWHLLTAHRGGHDHEHDHDGHAHGAISWGILAIVAVPLLLGTLIPSRPLGAEAVSGGVNISAVESAQVTVLSIPPLERNVLDWLRAFNRETDMTAFDGQPVDVIGFIYREPTFADDQFMVARFTVSCCVADASAIGLAVQSTETAALEQGSWVRVQGTLQVDDFRGERLPVVQPSQIDMVDQPAHPYLYP